MAAELKNLMRLSCEQQGVIIDTVSSLAGSGVEVRVYGSRLDKQLRGGDLDLILKSAEPLGYLVLAELKMTLEERLQLPVDIINCAASKKLSPFQSIALLQSQPLRDVA